MHEMGEWGSMPEFRAAEHPTRDRMIYLEYLREVHDDASFRLAVSDRLNPPRSEIDRLLFEAEMLANYGVVD
ncbi:MAG: hypothetical protein Kow0056_12060 [Coriobacteriia bacterium]